MEYTQEFKIDYFPFWSGAKANIDIWKDEVSVKAEESGEDYYEGVSNFLDAMQEYIEECFCDKTPTDTEINDFVWFDMDDWFDDYLSTNYPKDEEE